VAVVGAGIAGLAAALTLIDAGRDVLVLEQEALPGGLAQSDADGEWIFPRGPQSFLPSARHLAALVARLGLSDRVVHATGAHRRFIYRDRLHEVPSNPLRFATSRLLSARGKLRVMAEPFASAAGASDEESVSDFFTRRIGAEATRALVAPFVTGVHAGDPTRLEARSAFPRFVGWERESGSLVRGALAARREATRGDARGGPMTLRGGMGDIARAASAEFAQRLRVSEPVTALRRGATGFELDVRAGRISARRVILALPPSACARVLEESWPEASRLCAAVAVAPVAVVHVGGDVVPPPSFGGFGVLVDARAELEVLGIVFTSALFPQLVPAGRFLVSAYVGGTRRPELLDRSDEDLVSVVRDAMRRMLGFDPDGGVRRVLRHRQAIPQLEAGHARRIARLREQLLREKGPVLAGAWLDGIGLEAAAASGVGAATGGLREAA